MFWTEVPMIIVWWFVWFLAGKLGWQLIRRVFSNWADEGYIFGKIAGVIAISFVVWLLGIAKLLPFGLGSIFLAMLILLIAGLKINKGNKFKTNLVPIMIEELSFLILLLTWSFVKGHEPNISGLEKFMDFGFMKSILHSQYFPPADMWYAGKSINYYYFGHLYSAVMTKLSGIDLAFTFNLMLSTLFALTGTMGGAIIFKLLSGFDPKLKWLGVIIGAYILMFGGNLHTFYAFTQGYNVDDPPPFWQIWGKVDGTYWYPNATRFIPWTIHEFPAYSFIVSDIHGHVLGIPLVLLLISLLVTLFVDKNEKNKLLILGMFGFVLGCAFMTNALDSLIYLGLFIILYCVQNLKFEILNPPAGRAGFKSIFKNFNLKLFKPILFVISVFLITVLPFVTTFKSFVNGIAVNCPPAALANSRFGLIVFEEATKCQKSPVWMMLILWGLFVYGGVWLYTQYSKGSELETGMLWVSIFCLWLIIFPEFFYFRDIYPQHFRSNTMFKLGYQVFILMTFVTIYALIKGLNNYKKQWLVILGIIPLLYLVFIYPNYSVKGYFGEVKWDNYKGLNGVKWISNNYPDNYVLLSFLSKNIPAGTQPVMLEANGDSYTDYNMFSAFSGYPTVAGWTVHEWLWREGYGPISERAEEVRQFYEDINIDKAREFLAKYQVKYIVVSNFEKQKYTNLNMTKILQLATPVFTSGETSLYKVN